jgi:hypothetical protein
MFSNERLFSLEDASGRVFMVLVPRELVEEDGDEGTILARVIADDAGVFLVRVPGEPLSERQTVYVKGSNLTRA